jgi:hypothetical protein
MNRIYCIIIVCIALLIVGCSESKKLPTEPLFDNHDIVRVMDSGKQARVVDNKVYFVCRERCWKVRVEVDGILGKTTTLKNENDIEDWVEGG